MHIRVCFFIAARRFGDLLGCGLSGIFSSRIQTGSAGKLWAGFPDLADQVMVGTDGCLFAGKTSFEAFSGLVVDDAAIKSSERRAPAYDLPDTAPWSELRAGPFSSVPHHCLFTLLPPARNSGPSVHKPAQSFVIRAMPAEPVNPVMYFRMQNARLRTWTRGNLRSVPGKHPYDKSPSTAETRNLFCNFVHVNYPHFSP